MSDEAPVEVVQDEAPADGGWKSRKLALTAFAILVLFFGAWVLPVATFPVFAGAVTALVGAYHGANVFTRHIETKNAAA